MFKKFIALLITLMLSFCLPTIFASPNTNDSNRENIQAFVDGKEVDMLSANTDVSFSSVSDLDLIQYNSSTGKWENVSSSNIGTDKFKISSNDTTADYAVNKIIGTANEIVATETNDGNNETLVLSADGNITRDSEWDTENEVETAWSGTNIITETEIDTSLKLSNIIGDETGSGALVFGTSPTFITKIIAPKIEYNGDITIDAINAAADSTVTFTNSDATYNANINIEGDLTITGDDLIMNTNTSGAILVGDGTNYNPVVLSGDANIIPDGTLTINNDAVALTTDTTGNYVASIATNAPLTGGAAGSEGTTLTLDYSGSLSDQSDCNITTPSDGQLLLYDGITNNRFENVSMSGDVTINAAGITSISSGAIVKDDLAASTDFGDISTDASKNLTIDDGTVVEDDLAASLTFDDGDLLDLSTINASSTSEGIILPQAIDVSAATAEGQIVWDSDNDVLYVGDGTGQVQLGAASGDITAVGDITTGAAFTATSGADGTTLYFEGATADTFEVALTSADPNADVTVTLPAITGTVELQENIDTETELESRLTDATNIYTNNDGALNDDDLSNDDLDALQNVNAMTESQGDILYYGATGYTNLAAGTSGQVLTTQGVGADPTWTNAGTGDITDVWSGTAGNIDALIAAAGDTLNASNADSTIPVKVNVTAAPTTEGEMIWDSDNDILTIGDGVGTDYVAYGASDGSALSGDTATAFFSTGTLEHERGGLEADVSAYTGLLAVSGGATSEVDTKAELEAQISDVSYFVANANECTNIEGTALSVTSGTLNVTEADPTVDTSNEIVSIINTTPSSQIVHEAGGLEADVSAYSGLVAISTGTTSQINTKAGLEAQLSDVADLAEADGDTYSGTHDFGTAALNIPETNSVINDGQIALDQTDGKLIVQHSNAHQYLASSTDVAVGSLLRHATITIMEPDKVQAIKDNIPMMIVEADEFPHGIVIAQVYLKTDAASTLSVNLEKWSSPTDATPDTLTTIATASSTEANEAPDTTGVVGTGEIIMLDLDTTDVNWLTLTIEYYEPTS